MATITCKWIGIAVALALAAGGFLLVRSAWEANAAVEAMMAQEMAEESKVFCGKFGLGPDTPRHAECIAEVMEISKRHHQRMTSDVIGAL